MREAAVYGGLSPSHLRLLSRASPNVALVTPPPEHELAQLRRQPLLKLRAATPIIGRDTKFAASIMGGDATGILAMLTPATERPI